MDVRITARHFDLDSKLRSYVESKIARLLHYFDRVDEAHVVLEAEGKRMSAGVTVHASKIIISSEQEAADMRSAFDRAVDKVERQIRRHKEKVRHRKGRERVGGFAEVAGGAALEHVGIVSDELARRPMSTEEAYGELSRLGARFLVFWNSDSKSVNVIYSRDDGDYGLIEPGE